MKNKSKEEVLKIEDKVNSVVCNCCGKKEETPNGYYDVDITGIDVSFGYGSRFDLSTWEMDICDDCIEKWTKTFKHPIDIHNDVV